MLKNSEIEIKNVSLNPTRTGFMKVLERMGAHVETEVTREVPEPMGTVRLRHSPLKGARVEASEIPSLIDEIPILAVLATQAEGVTEIHGARELRVKESDRIEAVAKNLRAMGIELETFDDGLAVKGPQKLSGAKIETFLDHRIAMAFSIAGLAAEGETEILGIEPVETSYPGFYDVMKQLIKG
jgi:3-phosphoshikimate 1-carboxyvinyltransferase